MYFIILCLSCRWVFLIETTLRVADPECPCQYVPDCQMSCKRIWSFLVFISLSTWSLVSQKKWCVWQMMAFCFSAVICHLAVNLPSSLNLCCSLPVLWFLQMVPTFTKCFDPIPLHPLHISIDGYKKCDNTWQKKNYIKNNIYLSTEFFFILTDLL